MPINDIVATVSLVLQLKGGAVVGSASGFFYERQSDLFLVTNLHVVDKRSNLPDMLRLRLHRDSNNIASNGELDVPLYSSGQPVWKAHAKHPDADIALIKLDKAAVLKQFFVRAWSKDRFLPAQYLLDPGEDVFIMGFPFAFHDVPHNLPVFRNAMIASSYRVPFSGQPFFLTDARLHPGTSGSPVITKPKSTWVDNKGNTNLLTGTVYYIVGVHSGTIDPKMTAGQDIGLGAAWYIELVEEIAAQGTT